MFEKWLQWQNEVNGECNVQISRFCKASHERSGFSLAEIGWDWSNEITQWLLNYAWCDDEGDRVCIIEHIQSGEADVYNPITIEMVAK